MSSASRILVIDDDPGVQDVLSRFLGGKGYQVTIAVDGEAGLKALMEEPPNMVLLDLDLPKLSGLELLRRIQREQIDVKIIAISGHPMAEELLGPDSLRLGVLQFIVKPFDLDYLEAKLMDELTAMDV